MRIGIYPGSFDPFTNGHLDIVERAKQLCDTLIVAVARNSEKIPLFSIDERIDILTHTCRCTDGKVEITTFDGLLVEFCRERKVNFIVKGLRAVVDFEYENAISLMNSKLAPEIETIFLMSRGENSFISSRIVKEVASYGGDVSSLIPQFVQTKLSEKFSHIVSRV